MNRRLALIVPALAAILVFSNAHRNRWALDDHALVAGNEAAQSLSGALSGFFKPYWPPDENGNSAGLYRPLTLVSYAIDWTLSNGSPAWFHLTNVLLHALATVLVVAVALRWLPPPGAMVAGLCFAVHPVHVEAVANVVGRAEILSAIGILAAVLAARRYRATTTPNHGWLALVLVAVLFAQLSKENGVVAIAILGLDQLLEWDCANRRLVLYLWVAFVTVGWFHLWRSVAGGAVDVTVAPGIRWLTGAQRLATVLPLQFDVVRLLVWPMSLAASYDPQVVAQRTEFGLLAAGGLALAGAIATLGLLAARRAQAVSFGVLTAIIAYAPTSNLFFSAGLLLGERTLYLSSVAPVLVAGWAFGLTPTPARKHALLLVGTLIMAYSIRTYTRTPFWADMRSVITEDVLEHPEGYRTQLRIGEAFEAVGDSGRALEHYFLASTLFPADPFVAGPLVDLAGAMGKWDLALAEAARAFGIARHHPDMVALYARTLAATGDVDSALAIARAGFDSLGTAGTARLYLEILDGNDAPEWQSALAAVRYEWLRGRLISARGRMRRLRGRLAEGAGHSLFCWEVDRTLGEIKALDPDLEAEAAGLMVAAACDRGEVP